MQNGVTGAVRSGAGALCCAFTKVGGHAAKRALVDFAIVGAREGHAVVLEFDNGRNGFATHIFDGVLIAQPVRPLDGVVHVPFPVVCPHVTQSGAHATLRCHCVTARGKYLGYTGGGQACCGHAKRCPQTSTASADNDNVVLMFNNVVGHGYAPSEILSTETTPSAANRPLSRVTTVIIKNRVFRFDT